MARQKLSELTEVTTPTAEDMLYILYAGASRRVSIQNTVAASQATVSQRGAAEIASQSEVDALNEDRIVTGLTMAAATFGGDLSIADALLELVAARGTFDSVEERLDDQDTHWASLPGTNNTNLLLRVNRAGVLTVNQVEIGATDSGGAGYRMLRVIN